MNHFCEILQMIAVGLCKGWPSAPNPTVTAIGPAPVSCHMDCSEELNPICDNYNRTHRNPCLFQIASCEQAQMGGFPLKIGHFGICGKPKVSLATEDCPETPTCSTEFQPVCDTEGKTHTNPCLFNHARCLARRQGKVIPKCFQ